MIQIWKDHIKTTVTSGKLSQACQLFQDSSHAGQLAATAKIPNISKMGDFDPYYSGQKGHCFKIQLICNQNVFYNLGFQPPRSFFWLKITNPLKSTNMGDFDLKLEIKIANTLILMIESLTKSQGLSSV